MTQSVPLLPETLPLRIRANAFAKALSIGSLVVPLFSALAMLVLN